jgi:hypothetical protein
MTFATRLALVEAGLATLTDTDARRILSYDASMALHHLRPLPLACWQRCREIELARPTPRIKLSRLLDAHIFIMSSQSPSLPLSQSQSLKVSKSPSQHGGPRTPGPGKKLGRPKKPAKDRAVTTTITLSSPKAHRSLKAKAKRAKLTPGALIERDLNL